MPPDQEDNADMTPRRAEPVAPARLTWRARLALIGFAFLLLAVAELLLRLFNVAPPLRARDPLVEGAVLDRAYAPGRLPTGQDALVCPWISPDYPANFQPIPLAKDPAELRIFVFGGSSSVGYPYDGRLAFSSFLEAGLNAVAADRRARVINVAQNGIPAGTCLRLMREMAEYQPDVFVVYSGNNEYANDHVYRDIRRAGRAVAALRAAASNLALYRGMERVALPAKARLHAAFLVGDAASEAPAYSEPERRLIADNYEYVVNAMAELCAERGIGLVLCTVAANEADWPPYRSTFRPETKPEEREAWLRVMGQAVNALKAGNGEAALTITAGLEAVDDARADLHFVAGRALLAQGAKAAACARFTRAMELDNVCYRARPSQNRVLEDVARGGRAVLADGVAALRTASGGAPFGEDRFWDHCHPRLEAHEMIALCVGEALIGGGRFAALPGDWRVRWTGAVREYRRGVDLSPAAVARACRNTASGWMGLWTSHRAPDDLLRKDPAYLLRALQYLDMAVAADPGTPGTRFYRGVVWAQLGEKEKALADWRAEAALGSRDGPTRAVIEELLAGRIAPDRGFEQWLYIRNEMTR
jgi:hypothetical protein